MTDSRSYPGSSGLLPCPFCGGSRVGMASSIDATEWGVLCSDCGSSCSTSCDSHDEAVTSWNRRSGVPAQSSGYSENPELRQDDATERQFLEDNIATVAFHLGQPGAKLSVRSDKDALMVDPGEVLKEISRRLTVDPAQAKPDYGAEAQFLLDRLDEFDPGEEDAEREYHGHVAPAIARLRSALSSTHSRTAED